MAYVGSDDNVLYCINDLSGALAWSFAAGDDIGSSPAVSGTETVYVGSSNSGAYSINSDGSLAWSYFNGNLVTSSIAIGTDTVVVGSVDNNIYVLVAPTPTPTPTPTNTQTPTITPADTVTPMSIPPLVIDPSQLTVGQTFSIGIALVQVITRAFDYCLFAETPAAIYTIRLNGSITKGIIAIYRNVPRFNAPFFATVNVGTRIPASMQGNIITFYTMVVDAGKLPPVKSPSELTPTTPFVIVMDKRARTVS